MSTFSPAIQEFLAASEDARRLGPYRCGEVLDKGGTAPVFKAVEEHAGLSVGVVAVKVFDIGRAKGEAGAFQQRVVDEARSLCRVQHPNVVRFHTLATDAARGLMGLVMEFSDGISVDQELEGLDREDARRVALAVEIGIDIASALAAAHEAGIVHANVKPSNILRAGGTRKLINFGLASSLRSTSGGEDGKDRRAALALDDLPPDSIGRKASTLEKPGAESKTPLVGTVGYTDPVCLRTTAAPSAASDLYSLGATLYRCLGSDVPAVAAAKHAGKKGVDAAVLLGDAPAAPIAEVAPFTPPALAKLVDALVAPTREARPRGAVAVVRALERIRSALAGHDRPLPPEARGPFPGLDRYEASDRDVFFGRSADIAGVTELCRTRGLVGVAGLSGCGKSSLTRAGVVPAIEDGALGGWPPRYRSALVTPGADPMASMRVALKKLLGAEAAEHPAEIVQQLAASVDATGEGIVLLVDQLEEIVTLRDEKHEASALSALDLLSRLAEAPVGLRAIVAVRRDLLDELLAVDAQFSRALSKGLQLLGPLSSAGWDEVLDRSLDAYGYRFEDDALRKRVQEQLKGLDSAMPLAQFGLGRLWAQRDAKKKIIPKRAMDDEGLESSLKRHADTTIAALKAPREKLRDILLALTTPEGTRAHAKLTDLTERFGPEAKETIRAFESARLVIDEHEGVTFTHDAILREWPLLKGWLDAARDDRVLAAQLERDAARWMEARDPALLWRKGRLAAAIELWKTKSVPLSDAAWKFADQSSKEEARARFTFRLLAGLVVALLVGGSFLFAEQSRERADQARKDATALQVALDQVKALKQQMEESAMEAAASAALLADLQMKASAQTAAYGAQVENAMKKVSAAKDLDSAQKATAEIKAPAAAPGQVVPLQRDLLGPSGPSVPGPSSTGPVDSGAFDTAAIEKVVNSRKSSVKRRCLERAGEGTSSTKVTAMLTIGPSGNVQSVSTTGNDADVARCIEAQLKGWSFPAPGEVKQVQIPFVFVRQ